MSQTLSMLKNLKVLFIEDDEICGNIIKTTFGKYCAVFEWAKDGESGLNLYAPDNFDLVILDINLPKVNGFEAIEEILYKNPNQSFIVMTSFDTDSNLLKSLKLKAYAYIKKPVDIRDLEILLVDFVIKRKNKDKKFYLGDGISIDAANGQVYKNDKLIFLSPKLKKIFWLLYHNINRVVTYSNIISYVYNDEANLNTLRMAIVRIKKALDNNDIITNISGEGYILKKIEEFDHQNSADFYSI